MENCQTATGSVCVAVEDQSVSEAVIQAVAALTDSQPTTLSRLYDTVDPDALNALFADGTEGHVSFEYHQCSVTVHADETVTADRCPDEKAA